MDVLLDINSDQRDPYKFPTPQDYTICLNRPLYNVMNIKLEAAKIPISQTLINGGNNTFSMNSGCVVTLKNRNYANEIEFASNLQEQLLSSLTCSNVETVTYNSNTETLTFSNTGGSPFSFDFYSGTNGYDTLDPNGTPATVLGLTHQNVSATPGIPSVLTTGIVNLYPPTSIIIRMTTNEHGDDLGKDIYVSNGIFNFGDSNNTSNVELSKTESVYFGRILTYDSYQGNEYLIFQGGYPIEDYFHRGPEASITKLRFRFYYTIGGKLIPYDFGNKNHTLKFKIHCNLDKLEVLSKQTVSAEEIDNDLPPPIELPSLEPQKRPNKQKIIVYSFLLLLAGLFLLTLLNRK